ncbi:hypothetical protein B0H11DRAFT_1719537, partial [Mycena galericulata]
MDEESRVYYGPVLVSTPAAVVYVATSCSRAGMPDAKAAAGVYWGDGNRNNCVVAVPGTQSDARAAIYAVVHIMKVAPIHRALTIYTPSQYAIRSFCYWAGGNATRGWSCTHADIIRVGAELMRARPARVTFCWVDKNLAHNNEHLRRASALAKSGA